MIRQQLKKVLATNVAGETRSRQGIMKNQEDLKCRRVSNYSDQLKALGMATGSTGFS